MANYAMSARENVALEIAVNQPLCWLRKTEKKLCAQQSIVSLDGSSNRPLSFSQNHRNRLNTLLYFDISPAQRLPKRNLGHENRIYLYIRTLYTSAVP